MPLFTRSPLNPILEPTTRWWESRAVLNPGATAVGDRIALVYRAVGADGISRFGLAWTRDGERIEERGDLPWYEGATDDPAARLGVEDPRLTPLDGAYYLTYTKVSLQPASTPPLGWEFAPFRLRSAAGITHHLELPREAGLIVPDADTKDSVLFPQRIGGQFAALVREYPCIQYVTSSDLHTWSESVPVMSPLPSTWEGERVGAGPPPQLTPWGWLLLYHGNEYLQTAGNRRHYRMGLAILDRERPWIVRYRHPEPIFSPQAPYEIEGPVGNVVFGTGLVKRDAMYYLYYGAGDGSIGVATAPQEDLYTLLREACGSP